jgi:hypothetical protein
MSDAHPTADAMTFEEVPIDECGKCHSEREWKECWNCGGEGFSHHDCGEDCCCCAEPEDNVSCDICEGHGGFYVCARCYPESFDD